MTATMRSRCEPTVVALFIYRTLNRCLLFPLHIHCWIRRKRIERSWLLFCYISFIWILLFRFPQTTGSLVTVNDTHESWFDLLILILWIWLLLLLLLFGIIWSTDNSRVRCCQVVAIVMPAIQSIATMCVEWPAQRHLHSRRHLLRMIRDFPVAVANAIPSHVQCMSTRKKDIQSAKATDESTNLKLMNEGERERERKDFTSDNDRTGGRTQSSQHFDKSVSKTIGGDTPSHFVRSCNWRRFNWQYISVRNAMNAVNRGRDEFFIFCGGPNTLSRSWYHWRQMFSMASKYVSFFSFAMIEMQNRDVGKAYLCRA